MDLILSVVLIVCMLLWFFSAFGPAQLSAYPYAPHLLAWICVAILCVFVLGGVHGTAFR
jgi:hypothetical protein